MVFLVINKQKTDILILETFLSLKHLFVEYLFVFNIKYKILILHARYKN